MGQTTSQIDILIGERIRDGRKAKMMSQTDLAEKLGVSWQQVQKYERGVNRVSAARLWEISDILERPMAWFFADIGEELGGPLEKDIEKSAAELVVLMRHLGGMDRKIVLSFLKSMSETGKTDVTVG